MAESSRSVLDQIGTKRRRPIACNFCRQKKVRCDGECPCKNCTDHDEVCVFEKRKLRQKKQDISIEMTERLTRIEALFLASQKPSSNPHSDQSSAEIASEMTLAEKNADEPEPKSKQSALAQAIISQQHMKPWNESSVIEAQEGQSTGFLCQPLDEASSIHTSLQPHPSQITAWSELGGCLISRTEESTYETEEDSATISVLPSKLNQGLVSVNSLEDPDKDTTVEAVVVESPEDTSVYSGNLTNWEYHGPRSYLSICSPSGVQWVLGETKADAFQNSSNRLTQSITRRLKIESRISRERAPEPDSITAWRYISAHFEREQDTFECVDRVWFERKFKSYLEDKPMDEDPAWYCLRNAIYATGARIELTKTHGFKHAFETAWSFFNNCLVVHTELLFFRSSWMAVQALTIMGYFSEAIGNPCLEFMLSTVALRLACSKGLHRQGIPSNSKKEQEIKNKIFWASYCLEKNCAARSGRPSMIDDDHITCQLPHEDYSFNVPLIKISQFSSLICKELTKLEGLCFPRTHLVQTMLRLNKRLKSLKLFLKRKVDLESPLDISAPRVGASSDLQREIYIRMSYYTVVLDMHTFLTNPWSRRFIDLGSDIDLQDQLRKSQDIVADVSRQAILATQFLRLDATSLVLVAFQCPLYALINLFVHIVQNPECTTIQSDLALMDIGAAHFSRLEYSTNSEISVPFARDLVDLARSSVAGRKKSSQNLELAEILPETLSFLETESGLGRDIHSTFEDFNENTFLPDLETCSTFLPTADLNEPIGFLI